MERIRRRFPIPGQRILRSACAVGLCFGIYFLRGQKGIPFYSALAVLQCMQPYHENTLAVAKRRTIGTFMGAFWGLIIILLEIYGFEGKLYGTAAVYLLIACFTGVVLYSTVILKITDTAYFSCVVFLSITVMHIKDADPYLFVLNRIVDTLIGVVLALLVNSLHLPRKKNKDILFISGVDDTILDSQGSLSTYSKVELNRLIEQGANFTISTMRTPANIRGAFAGVNLRLPVIAMDGAVLYDLKENYYLMSYEISDILASGISAFLEQMEVESFTNVLIDDMLVIYYKDFSNETQWDIYTKLHKSPYRNYVKRPIPKGERVLYFMLIEEKAAAEHIYNCLMEQLWKDELRIIMYDSHDYPGYAYIKIFNKEATRENMLQNLMKRLNIQKSVTFGSIEGKSDIYIQNADKNEMVKALKKQFEPVIWEAR